MNVSFLQRVYEHRGPFSSVFLDVSRDAEDAEHAIGVRWRHARDDLARQGAEEETLRAVESVIGASQGQPPPRGQVVVAASGAVVFDASTREPPQDYVARVGPLPHVMPFLAVRDQHVPYVLAIVDSIGADITTVDIMGTARNRRVEGDAHPTHKPRGGAEHHKQMQRAVDERVKLNAEKVADEVQHLAVNGGAEVIMLAGEVEARRAVSGQLAEGLRNTVVEAASGSRAAGLRHGPLEAELADALTGIAARRTRSVVDRFEQERAAAHLATEGLAATVEALRRGQVAVLLCSAGSAIRDDEVWIGPRAEQTGFGRQELVDMGAEDAVTERLDAALVRAAAGTSADLVFVPEEVTLKEGVGGLLRFTDPNLPA